MATATMAIKMTTSLESAKSAPGGGKKEKAMPTAPRPVSAAAIGVNKPATSAAPEASASAAIHIRPVDSAPPLM